MSLKLISVVKFYDDYTIGYVRYGNVNIYAEIGTDLTDTMYSLVRRMKAIRESYNFY
jgi:hypothetical protein